MYFMFTCPLRKCISLQVFWNYFGKLKLKWSCTLSFKRNKTDFGFEPSRATYQILDLKLFNLYVSGPKT